MLASLCLTITWHDALEVLLSRPRGKALLFLWPRDVPPCTCRLVLIRPCSDGHLVVPLSTAAVNAGGTCLSQLVFASPGDECPESGLLGHVVVLLLIFEGLPCFPQWLLRLTVPRAVRGGSL